MNTPAFNQSAAVHYRVEVLDAAGRLVRRLPRKRNLILDQGLDGIAVRSWADSFTHATVGTGTTPTKRDSGAVTVQRVGNTLIASAGFFENADVGRLFKFDSGEEVRITAYIDAQNVTTSTAGAIAAAEGTVWYVNQTALIAEVKRTSTYSGDGGANGSTYSVGTYTHKRTFLFSAEAGPVTYREIGWSHTAAAGANLFGRDLLAGAGVSLAATQILRVVVELTVAYSPVTPTAYASIATGGWSQNGMCGIVSLNDGQIVRVNSAGASTGSGGLEPSVARNIILSTSSAALSAATTAGVSVTGTLADVTSTLGAYVAGSFTRTKSAVLGVSVGNSAAIRSIAIGYDQSQIGFRVLLDAAEAKTSSQTLTLGFTFAWGRILSNA